MESPVKSHHDLDVLGDNVALTLDVVLLPGLAPEQPNRDAGCDAGQRHVQQPGLAQVLRHVIDLAAATPESEAACQEENSENRENRENKEKI